MGAMKEYFQLDTSSLLQRAEVDHTISISCKALKDGNIKADGVVSSNGGVEIKTVTVGTPESFRGYELLTIPNSIIEFNSNNQRADSQSGSAAVLGKYEIQKCWNKLTPSI